MQDLQSIVYEKRNEIVNLLNVFREDRQVARLSGATSERNAVGEGAMRNLQEMVTRKKKTFGNDPALFVFEVQCLDVSEMVRRAAVAVAMEHIKFSRNDLRLDLCRTLEAEMLEQDMSSVAMSGLVDYVETQYNRLEKNPAALAHDPGFSEEFLDVGDLSTDPYGGFN